MNNKPTSPQFLELLETTSMADIGPARRPEAWPLARLEEELRKHPLMQQDHSSSKAIASLVLLWHDHLDASHEISQSLHTPDGSYLHGMMHRREPDYFNAKYWFRKSPSHPAFEHLADETKKLLLPRFPEIESLLPSDEWDPFWFVDACERAAKPGDARQKLVLQAIQKMEFLALLKWLSKS
ncbi:MAG: hypothetical protein ACO1QB_09395 [Verrucomicrobiales bacterium]